MNPRPLLSLDGIVKSFPGVRALQNGRLELRPGEVHALLGENGAGKSTLIRILAGALAPDAGSVLLDGAPVHLRSPHEARRRGISVIFQEFNLVPAMSVRENLFLGQEQASAGILHHDAERKAAQRLLDRLGASFHPDTPCRDLSIAEQQLVEIAKALLHDTRILVMDEPTAALSGREVDRLFGIVRDLRAQGIAIVYVSHRLDEVFALCDRATVLRDGRHVFTGDVSELTRAALIEHMVGRSLDAEFPRRRPTIGPARLVVRNLQRGTAVRDVSFEIRRGEILGLAGLVGAGRTETARLLFGADRPYSGTIALDGIPLRIRSPRDAIRAGICLLTEDRKHQGLVLNHSVLENFGLPNLPRFSRFGLLRPRSEVAALRTYVDELRIRIPHTDQRVGFLSGGNQQKVVLAKWLETEAEVVLVDEPTRGVDVGARFEIYQILQRLADAGKAVLMISSDLPEILGMSDRILVMHAGCITGEIVDVPQATQADVLRLATAESLEPAGPTSPSTP